MPVGGLVRAPHVMFVTPSFPAKTVAEFIAYAKANPGKVNYASAGTGNANHITAEMFKMMTGIDMVHVPYRGGAPALIDLVGGQVQVMFADTLTAGEQIKSGTVRAIGGRDRSALAGAAGRAADRRCRAGLRRQFLVGHRRAARHARRDRHQAQRRDQCGPRRAEAEERFADMGALLLGGSPAEFGKMIANETDKWGKVVKFAGAKAE